MITRPSLLKTITIVKTTGCGKIYITITEPSSEYKEIFAQLGKSGGCAAAFTSNLTVLITYAWNLNIPLEKIIKHLKAVQCPNCGPYLLSCQGAIAEVLEETQNDNTQDN